MPDDITVLDCDMDYSGLLAKLDSRAQRIRGYIASSQVVVSLLAPEYEKFEARTQCDVYTVRMAVDHKSSIRTQTKEAGEYEDAAAAIRALLADRHAAEQRGVKAGLEAAAKWIEPWGTSYDSGVGDRYATAIRAIDPATVLAKDAPDGMEHSR